MIWLRSILFMVAFYLWSTVSAIVMLPTLAMPRAACVWTLRVWGRQVTWLLRVICDVKVEVLAKGCCRRIEPGRGPAILLGLTIGIGEDQIFGDLA